MMYQVARDAAAGALQQTLKVVALLLLFWWWKRAWLVLLEGETAGWFTLTVSLGSGRTGT